jgi:two-component system CheB/CheR fusion protein
MIANQPPPSLIVGVGASAGGLDAFRRLLSALPGDTGMAFIFVQHLDPSHRSMLCELLEPHTQMRVFGARAAMVLEPDCVYVIQPDTDLGVRDGKLEVSPPSLERGLRLPVDHLFCSLAREFGPRAVGVVLSGAGSDGSVGTRQVKGVGGLTIAQRIESAVQPGMPSGAIEAGTDLVLEIEEIPNALGRFAAAPPEIRATLDLRCAASPARGPSLADDASHRVMNVLRENCDFDAKIYKPGMLARRVLRRVPLVGFDTVDDYLAYLEEDAEEQQALRRDLLISVTEFFRDPEAFEALAKAVIETIVADAAPGQTLRVWVPACATGEEAYSLAILFLDAIEARGEELSLCVFATDIDEEALSRARVGIYPTSITSHLSTRQLARYFTDYDGKSYRVRGLLRDCVSFAVHDLCKDPPFSRMHLVSCRNLLIYLRAETQAHVIRALHFALRSSGYLMLGSSESPGAERGLFATVVKSWRLYRKIGGSRNFSTVQRDKGDGVAREVLSSKGAGSRRGRGRGEDLARQAIMGACVSPTLLIADDNEIVFMHGDLQPYLRFPQGEPRHDLTALIRPEFATRVRAVLYKCRRSRDTVVAQSIVDAVRGQAVQVTARVAPGYGEAGVIISFDLLPPLSDGADAWARAELQPGQDATRLELERELEATRDDLRSTVEELEVSNQELRASNEESMSMNEELQSANEELEATTEELRSLNEELSTVNNQLRQKVEELEQAHDDLSNFFASTGIATLFLDEELRIKRLTPAAATLLGIDHSDRGRRIDSFAHELLQNELGAEARAVLDKLSPQRRDLSSDGRWLVRRILPYRTEDRRIAGVVVNYLDVSELKQATDRLAIREKQQATIANLGIHALEEGDLEGFMNYAVREIQGTFASDFCKILELCPDGEELLLRAGVGWDEGLVGEVRVPASLDSQAGFTLQARESVIVTDLASEGRFSGPALLVDHDVVSGLSCPIGDRDDPYGVLGVHTRTPRVFTSEDAHFLQAVATVISHAIDRHLGKLRRALESRVSQALARASDLEAAAANVHATFAHEAGIVVTELWWPSQPLVEPVIECRAIYVEPSFDRNAFAERMCQGRYRPGQGLIGRVWEQGKADWASAARGETRERLEAATALGLASGVAFPIMAFEEVFGVVVVHTVRRMVVERMLLRRLPAIGRLLADLVVQQRARVEFEVGEQRFRETFDNAAVGISHNALDGRWLRVNDRLCEITGYSREELLRCSFQDVTHPDDLELDLERAAELEAGVIDHYSLEKRYVRKSGEPIWVYISVSLRRRRDGEPDYFIAVIEDISERKRVEHGLAQLAAIVDNSDDAILSTDIEGRITSWNQGAERLYGYTADEVIGQPVRMLWPADDDPTTALVDGQIWDHQETRHCDKRDNLIDVSFSMFRLSEPTEKEVVVAMIARDIRATKRVERRLKKADQQKNEFLAMLGHELRNPLSSVRSAAELLALVENESPELARIQETLARQTAHMAKLIDGLLDVSRIIRGKIEIERQPVDMVRVVERVLDDARPRAEGLELRAELPEEPLWVRGDVVRLTQVIDNLISNAIQFTQPPGKIFVELRAQGERVIFEVRDTGRGIAPELFPEIFEVFRQAKQDLARSGGGLGLGLALVKLLVELHEGWVRAHSDGLDCGAQFVIELPRIEPTREPANTSVSEPGPRRILIVEDNDDAAALLSALLQARGHEVAMAASGHEALERLERFDAEVILCDLGLPDGMSGYDLAEVLRGQGRDELLLVAISGYGRPQDKQRAKAAGFDDHLTKPVALASLEKLLARG